MPKDSIRDERDADVWQANTTRGRADGDLPDDVREQWLHADRWIHRRHVGVHELLANAASGAGSGIHEPANGG